MKILLLSFSILLSMSLFCQEVEVIGDLKIANGSQGEGRVLVSDANGVSTWVSKTDLLIDLHSGLDGGVRRLILWGISPLDIWEGGVHYDSIIGINIYDGLNLESHIIFYLDTLDIYPFEYLTTGNEAATFSKWACETTAINGADSELLGDGIQNTLDVVTDCPSPPNGNSIFTQYTNGGINVHIASVEEASLIYSELIETGIYNPFSSFNDKYWTSSEAQGANESTHAMVIDKTTGLITEELKTSSMRAFLVSVNY